MCQVKSLRVQNMQYHNVYNYYKTNSVSFTKYNYCLGSINRMYENTFSNIIVKVVSCTLMLHACWWCGCMRWCVVSWMSEIHVSVKNWKDAKVQVNTTVQYNTIWRLQMQIIDCLSVNPQFCDTKISTNRASSWPEKI